MFTVTISEKGGQQSKYDFNKTEITIGRMKGNDIVLPKGNVSKQHTRIFLRETSFFIVDLGSTNGTYVNGRKVAVEQALSEADKIYIGDFILQVEAPAKAAPPPPKAPPQPPRNPTFPPQQAPSGRPSASIPMNAPAPMPMGKPNQPERTFPVSDVPNLDPMRVGTPLPMSVESPRLDFDDLGIDMAPVPVDNNRTPTPEPRRPFNNEPSSPSNSNLQTGAPAARSGQRNEPSRSQQPQQPQQPQQAQQNLRSERSPNKGVGAPRAKAALVSEFDTDFHAAQHDVARILFESLAPEDLSLYYPPDPADRSKYEKSARAALSKVNPRVDRDALLELMTTECVGLGPIEQYLDDPRVRDIYVNRYDRILIRRDGQLIVAPRAFSHPEFLTIAAHRLLGARDVPVGVDEVRFSDGTRVHIVMPPVAADGPVLTVRKPNTYHPSLDDLVQEGALSHNMAEFLLQAVEAGRSILIAGPTSAGKTTLLSAIGRTIDASSRTITIEESSSLMLPQESVVRLEASAGTNYDMRYLIRSAAAMHPQRIIVDECRGGEAYDWVTSAASGTEGSMITVHATSAPDALGRMESLCLLGSNDVSPRGLREQIARAVNLVVVVNSAPSQGFRVQQITEVQGVDLDAFRLSDVFYYRVEGTEGAFHPTGYIPLFFEDLRHAGVDVDFTIFRE
ncbi:MAG: Flp pilus assembly complex ATPase component TadA [Bradymonadaceae bacterium]|nr:Flp pilus assembly complex ATPase component TadA [Lujinxingiaceae bacterium]